jgi:hypothetical protein
VFQIEDVGIGTRPQARLFYDAGNFVYCGGLEFIVLEFFAEFCPPAPVPLAEAPGPMALLRVLAKNPLEAWTAAHFAQAVVVSGLAVVSDPAAIHRVLFENCDILENDSTGVIGCPLTVAGRNWGTPHSKTV